MRTCTRFDGRRSMPCSDYGKVIDQPGAEKLPLRIRRHGPCVSLDKWVNLLRVVEVWQYRAFSDCIVLKNKMRIKAKHILNALELLSFFWNGKINTQHTNMFPELIMFHFIHFFTLLHEFDTINGIMRKNM